MRIKLLVQNIRCHFVISVLLWMSLSFLLAITLMKLEYTQFVMHYNLEEYVYQNNGFDIVIQSTMGISTYGSKQFRDQYEKCASFYRVAVVGEANEKSEVINVFEGKTDYNDQKYSYQNAFSFDATLLSNQTIITTDLAQTLGIDINDTITLHIGENTYTYEVVKIVNNEGFFSRHSMLVTGTVISKTFSYIFTMVNLICIKVNDRNELKNIHQNLNTIYESYQVTNIRDQEYIESLISKDADVYIMMTIFILLGLFLLIRSVYRKKLKKQQKFLSSYSRKYYQKYLMLARGILFLLSYILAIGIVQTYFYFTAGFYSHPFRHFIHWSNCLIVFLVGIVLYGMLSVNIKIKNKINKKVYWFPFIGILILIEIVALCFQYSILLGFTSVILAFCIVYLVILFVFHSFQKIKSFLKRVYVYDLSKHSILDKINIGMYITIACFFSIILTSMIHYHQSIQEMNQLIRMETVVVTNKEENVPYDKIGIYDCIKINDGKQDLTIDTVLGLDAEQVGKYTSTKLTTEEGIQYNSGNSILLSVYFKNKLNCQIGDEIKVKLPETDTYKTYRIIQFIDTIYYKFAIISKDDTMMVGYVIQDNLEGLKHNLNRTTYNVIDVEKQTMSIQNFYQINFKQVVIVLGFIMLIFLFFLFYLSYVDLENKKESIRRLKQLGLSNQKCIRLNVYKMGSYMLISFPLAIFLSSVVVYFFEDIASLFHTTFFIHYHFQIILLASFCMLVCMSLGMLYTNYVICKEKR